MKYYHCYRERIFSKASLRLFWSLSIFLTISLIGAAIFQIQSLAQKSEFVSQTQESVTALSQSNSNGMSLSLSAEISKLDELAQNLDFENIDEVFYIRTIESTVLAR